MSKEKQVLLVAQHPDGRIVEVGVPVRRADEKKAHLEGAGYKVEKFDPPAPVAPFREEPQGLPPAAAATAGLVLGLVGIVLAVAGMIGEFYLLRWFLTTKGGAATLWLVLGEMVAFWWLVMWAAARSHAKARRSKPQPPGHPGRIGGSGASGYVARRSFFKGIR